jgi:hypothetical protein
VLACFAVDWCGVRASARRRGVVVSDAELTVRPKLPTPSEQRRRSLTKADRAAFLSALSNGWSVRHAAVHAGRHWRRFYTLRERDEAFAAQWAEAEAAGTDVLEHEAYRRAVEGVAEPVYQGGELVGTVQRYSDRLLEFLLRGRRPQVYRDNVSRVELTGADGGPVELNPGFEPTTLTDVVRLAAELGLLPDVVDGESEDAPLELTDGAA